MDNSGENTLVVVEKEASDVFIHQSEVPEWINIYLLNKLKG